MIKIIKTIVKRYKMSDILKLNYKIEKYKKEADGCQQIEHHLN